MKGQITLYGTIAKVLILFRRASMDSFRKLHEMPARQMPTRQAGLILCKQGLFYVSQFCACPDSTTLLLQCTTLYITKVQHYITTTIQMYYIIIH